MASDAAFTPTVIATIRGLMAKAEATGERVAAWGAILKALQDAKLAWPAQAPPEFVGIHPENRSSLGVLASEAHHHGAQILQAGFSWRLAADATAVEAPPPPHNEAARAANDQMVALSDGLLPPLASLKYLSVGGGHTNSWLRAVKAGCPSAVPSLGDASGKLNAEALTAGRPGLGEAVQAGLRWTILHWEAPRVFPGLVHLVQAALNTHAKGDQGEVEVLLDLDRMRRAAIAAGSEPKWQDIIAAAGRSLPVCGPWIPALAQYVQAQAPELLEELSLFHKAFGRGEKGAQRMLGSEYFSKLVALNFGPGEKFPLTLLAAVEANLASPPNKIVDGQRCLLTPTALSNLPSTKVQVREAEKAMGDCRSLCKAMDVPEAARVKLIGRLDVRCICFLTGKGKDSEGRVFASCGQITEACADPSQSCSPGWMRDASVSSIVPARPTDFNQAAAADASIVRNMRAPRYT